MKHTRKIACLLAILMTASAILCGCGSSTDDPADTHTQTTEEGTSADTRIPSSLPEDLNFGGEEVNVWFFTTPKNADEFFYDLNGDLQGDEVSSAMYERNVTVEELLKVDLTFTDTGVDSASIGAEILRMQMSDDTSFDLYSVIQWNAAEMVFQNCYLDVSDAPYLDFDQPWWSTNYMSNLSTGDACYFLAGDISLDMIRCNSAIYYNKDIYNEVYQDPEGLYRTVLDQAWTMEAMTKCIQDAFSDNNGNGKADDGDRYGMMTNTYYNVDAFTFGAGAVLVRYDENNSPYLTIEEAHNVDVYDRTYDMFYKTLGTVISSNSESMSNIRGFAEGKSLFLPGFFHTSEHIRDMRDYGVIPFPKYDMTQENYISSVHDLATLMCLPANCDKVETVCAVVEAMAYYGYYEITPVYYERALKAKYVHDSQSAQMVDIIHAAAMTDFAYVYPGAVNNVGMIMRTLMAEKSTSYASRAKSQTRSAERCLNEYIKAFNKE